jgi:ribosomal protein S18 acetylase RimI-like enzyme
MARMQRLAAELWRRIGPRSSVHIGDLPWRMYQHLNKLDEDRVELWLEGDDAVAWGWLDDGELDLEVHPDHAHLAREVLAWAQPRSVLALAIHSETVRMLEEAGYRPSEKWYEHMVRSLDGTLPEAIVPEGYRLRTVDGDADVGPRVEVHRAAFAPSRVVRESYRAVMSAFPYRAALDNVVVAPDGTFAAFCLCWIDVENRVGLLEPVGTHPAHRRRGLAAAVCLAGLHALSRAGADTAVIYSAGASQAFRVYERIGFRSNSRQLQFTR